MDQIGQPAAEAAGVLANVESAPAAPAAPCVFDRLASMVPTASLHEDANNPRTEIAEAECDELADDIRTELRATVQPQPWGDAAADLLAPRVALCGNPIAVHGLAARRLHTPGPCPPTLVRYVRACLRSVCITPARRPIPLQLPSARPTRHAPWRVRARLLAIHAKRPRCIAGRSTGQRRVRHSR